jgi:succinate dehydrogenase / fumarate reductase flavoprotein subunit
MKVVAVISAKTPDGEADRKDDEYSYVAAWELKGDGQWELHKEALNFEIVKPTQRSYK